MKSSICVVCVVRGGSTTSAGANFFQHLAKYFDRQFTVMQRQVSIHVHLDSPFYYLRHLPRYDPAVCWFKATARDHLARAWELVSILERNGVFIWTVKSRRTGYVYYEDQVQVFARPYADVRLLL